MDHLGREHGDARMSVFPLVPGEELGAETAHALERAELLGSNALGTHTPGMQITIPNTIIVYYGNKALARRYRVNRILPDVQNYNQ